MSQEQARQLREQGISLAKAGKKAEARKLLQQSLRLNSADDTAWLFLASVAQDKRERLLALKKVLEINPSNDMAIKAVRALGINPELFVPQPKSPPSVTDSLADDDITSDESGIPIPAISVLESAKQQAVEAVDTYTQRLANNKVSDIEWVHKTKRRAGEREIFLWRMQIGIAILVFSVFVVGGGLFAIFNSPDVRLTLFGASDTPRPPTRTPTLTPTQTPGFTFTPSPTRPASEPSFTPLPPVNLGITSVPIEVTARSTELYIPVQRLIIRDVAELIAIGDYESALDPLATERALTSQVFDPNPYYYSALAYAGIGDADTALNLLTEAETRIDELDGMNPEDATVFSPLIQLGFAQVYLYLAEDALANRRGANDFLTQASERAERAIEEDELNADAYVALSRAYRLRSDYQNALDTLNQGLAFPDLTVNQSLIVEKGNVYLAQGTSLLNSGDTAGAREALHNALYQGFVSIYINPHNEPSHQLRVQASLALDDPGLAVIYSQEQYLFFFPNNPVAYELLGEARIQEENYELALNAYSNAIENGAGDDGEVDALIGRAGVYSLQRRYNRALEDLNVALALRDDLSIRATRMRVAYLVGDYGTVDDDAEALLGTGIIPDGEIRLFQAQSIIDQADDNELDAYNDALNLLSQVGGLSAELAPVADEYRARVHLRLGNLGDALNAINQAMSAVETGSRHYIRGQILQAQDSLIEANVDFQWVLTWSQVFNYPFIDDVYGQIEVIRIEIARRNALATADVQTATAQSVQATNTAVFEASATAEQATIEFFETNSPTPSPSPTATITPSITPTPTRTLTPSVTSTPEPTPTREDGTEDAG